MATRKLDVISSCGNASLLHSKQTLTFLPFLPLPYYIAIVQFSLVCSDLSSARDRRASKFKVARSGAEAFQKAPVEGGYPSFVTHTPRRSRRKTAISGRPLKLLLLLRISLDNADRPVHGGPGASHAGERGCQQASLG